MDEAVVEKFYHYNLETSNLDQTENLKEENNEAKKFQKAVEMKAKEYLLKFYAFACDLWFLTYEKASENIDPAYLPLIFVYIILSFFFYLYYKFQKSLLEREGKILTSSKNKSIKVANKHSKKNK